MDTKHLDMVLLWRLLNPFVPKEIFLYPLKISGGRESVHWEQMG